MARSRRGGQRRTSQRPGKNAARDSSSMGSQQQRRHLADEAARIMQEEGLRDFQMAKRKAAGHLGLNDSSYWPSNDEIELALSERLSLFGGHTHRQEMTNQWRVAVEAMTLFSPFNPRLTGALVRGSATGHMPIEIHLFADTTEEVTVFLFDNDIEYELCDRQFRTGHKHQGNDQHQRIVGVRLEVDPAELGDTTMDYETGSHTGLSMSDSHSPGIEVVALVFPPDSIRQPPKSPIDGRPMQRVDLDYVRQCAVETTASPGQ